MHSAAPGRALADNESGCGGIHAPDDNLHVLESQLGRTMFRNAFPAESPKQIQAVGQDNALMQADFRSGERLADTIRRRDSVAIDQLHMQASRMAIGQQSLMEIWQPSSDCATVPSAADNHDLDCSSQQL
jgi:hypothetical protein